MKVSVKAMKLNNSSNSVKGIANAVFGDQFLVGNLFIVEAKNGGMFVSMPSYKTKTIGENGKAVYKDIAYPLNKEFRELLNSKVLESYKSGETVEFEV